MMKVMTLRAVPYENGYVINEMSHLAELKSLDEISKELPEGVYSTFRTFQHDGVLDFGAHIRRLKESARLSKHEIAIHEASLREAIRNGLAGFATGEARVRLTLDLNVNPGDIYISFERLVTPSKKAYELGVKAITRRLHRENPKAKGTSFLGVAEKLRKTLPAGINEILMVSDDGKILEGLSSNFFAVIDGEIWTADEGVLSGITRSVVLDIAEKTGVVVKLCAAPLSDLSRIDEAFITSTSRSILPVVNIDQTQIGNGKPGPVTIKVMTTFDENLKREIEKI